MLELIIMELLSFVEVLHEVLLKVKKNNNQIDLSESESTIRCLLFC